MSYATQDNIEAVYPGTLASVADYNGDGAIDDSVVTAALVHADGIINSYLSVRYTLPLPIVPEFLMKAAVDIAVYNISNTADRLTAEVRRRYEDVIAHLKDIAAGKAGLGIIDPDPDDDEVIEEPTPGRAYSFQSVRG